MKTAVIVAAGLSSRLYPLTETTPKSLLPLGKEKILERNLKLLKKLGFEKIYIVTGYRKEMIESQQFVKTHAQSIYNPFYKLCNNMGSLYSTKHLVNNMPFLYLHGDVVFTEKLLCEFIQNLDVSHSIDLAVDFKKTDEEAMKVHVTEDHYLIESNKEITKEKSAGEWIGLAYIHNPESTFAYIEKALADEKLNVYDTYAFSNMAYDGHKIKCLPTNGEKWTEIDFIEDYELAKRLFGHE